MARVVLVTGGGTGIGKAVAERFAEAGDSVTVTGRRLEPLRELAAESGVTPVVCDHSDPGSLARLVKELPERVDVLVNNAGGNTDFDADPAGEEPEGAGSDHTEAQLATYARDFRANLEANLLSAALTTWALEGRLAAGGAVIHVGSIAADQGAGSYGASKAGLAAWNVDAANALGSLGVTANVVSPGYVAGTEFFRGGLPEGRHDALVAATATGRAGTPADIAATVAFLASPGARHITGQVVHVNGGAHRTR